MSLGQCIIPWHYLLLFEKFRKLCTIQYVYIVDVHCEFALDVCVACKLTWFSDWNLIFQSPKDFKFYYITILNFEYIWYYNVISTNKVEEESTVNHRYTSTIKILYFSLPDKDVSRTVKVKQYYE